MPLWQQSVLFCSLTCILLSSAATVCRQHVSSVTLNQASKQAGRHLA